MLHIGKSFDTKRINVLFVRRYLSNYRTMSIRIKKGHKLYGYFDDLSKKVNNLYNTTNFFVRQVFSGIPKTPENRQPNEIYVIDTINSAVSGRFSLVSGNDPYVNYYVLDHADRNLLFQIQSIS